MSDTMHWFSGVTAFLLVGGGLVSYFQAEAQTRARADALGKQMDEAWQQDRVSRVKKFSVGFMVLGAIVLLPSLFL